MNGFIRGTGKPLSWPLSSILVALPGPSKSGSHYKSDCAYSCLVTVHRSPTLPHQYSPGTNIKLIET